MMNRKRQGRCSGSERSFLSGSSVRRGRILAMASVLAVAPMITGFPQVSSQAQAHPVTSHLRHVGFVKSSVVAMRSARDATRSAVDKPGAPDPISTARAGAVTPVQHVAGAVTVVGVTWPKGSVSAHGKFQIRTMTGPAWSKWQPLDTPDGGPDGAEAASATGGTDPYVVTGASKYEVRSLTTDIKAPTSATVQAVDPGTSSADDAQPTPGAASAAAAKPAILTRAAWGANESLRRVAPTYGKIVMGFVHHTDSSNSYTASQVPAIIRGFYAYHVKSLGWNDIGYNYLVDRFGRTWEGRYGGVTRAVVGAQTMNYNSVSTGVAAIGNFDVAAAPPAMTNAFKRIFAWKFQLAGIPATGSVPSPRPPSWSTTYFQRISGHRNAFQTACPGRYLYAKLPEIRSGTAALMHARASTPAPKPRVAKPAVVPPWAVTWYRPYKGYVLRQHSRGAVVVAFQRALRVHADGIFGARTRAVLVAFQRKQRISANGVVTRLVWDRFERRDFPLIAYHQLTLRQGSRGSVVAITQRALRVHADGIFGPATAAAVRAVQRGARIAPTGVVSRWTWGAIERRMPR